MATKTMTGSGYFGAYAPLVNAASLISSGAENLKSNDQLAAMVMVGCGPDGSRQGIKMLVTLILPQSYKGPVPVLWEDVLAASLVERLPSGDLQVTMELWQIEEMLYWARLMDLTLKEKQDDTN